MGKHPYGESISVLTIAYEGWIRYITALPRRQINPALTQGVCGRLKISNRFILFIILSVVTAVFLVVVGGALTLRQLAYEQQAFEVSTVVQLLDTQLDVQPDTPQFAQWLPNWLRANHIVRLEVSQTDSVIYVFRDIEFRGALERLVIYQVPLIDHDRFTLKLWLKPPIRSMPLFSSAYLYILGGLLIVAIGLWSAIGWLKRSLYGAELLERRGRLILNGHLYQAEKSDPAEWPRSASLSLSELLAQLQDARKDRARFDRLIRLNAFVDDLTGLGNQTQFVNRLESELSDVDAPSGFIMLLYLKGMDDVNFLYDRAEGEQLLQQCSQLMANFFEPQRDASLARFDGDHFAMMLPRLTFTEVEKIAAKLLNQLGKIELPGRVNKQEFFYIGIAGYQFGLLPDEIMSQAEEALRVAERQEGNSWFVGEQELRSSYASKGSVRWRVLLETVLEHRQFAFFEQQIVDGKQQPIALELLLRIRDGERWLTSRIFMPWVSKCGLMPAFDRVMIDAAMKQSMTATIPVCVNLDVGFLSDQAMVRTLIYWAMEQGQDRTAYLVIELEEAQLVALSRDQTTRLMALRDKGIVIAVDRAGQSVVSTQYIAELKPSYLKLHPSLVRDIHRHQVNRLAISSLLASANKKTKVIAVGIERREEWRVLQRLGVSGGQGHYFHRPQLQSQGQ
jgi:RNase E specificity factor CsrD